MPKAKEKGPRAVADNRSARYDFFILETFEAGIELKGSEVKSLRDGKAQLKEGYARIRDGEIFLEGVHISPYSHARKEEVNEVRSRRLLMHKREISRLQAEVSQKRLTLVPLRIYFKNGKAKVELGLAKGKKQYDKRASIKERDAQKSLDQAHRRR